MEQRSGKVSRETLYAEVWSEPMTTVARRYEVSSNYLARICERLDVPRPGRGHWQQVAAGYHAKREPLPRARPGSDIEWARDGSSVTAPLESASAVVASSRRRGVPGQIHQVMVGAKEHFANARPLGWLEGPGYVRPHKRNLVDVVVSKETLGRALEEANRFFVAMKNRGLNVALANRWSRVDCNDRAPAAGDRRSDAPDLFTKRWHPDRPTVVFVQDVPIGLTVFEVREHLDARYDSASSGYVRVTAASGRRPSELVGWACREKKDNRAHRTRLLNAALWCPTPSPTSPTAWKRVGLPGVTSKTSRCSSANLLRSRR